MNLEKTYHMEGKRYLSALSHNLLLLSSLEHFSNGFLPTTPASQPLDFMNCWVWWPTAHSYRWKKWKRFPLSWLLLWSLSSPYSPPMCDINPLSQIPVSHFHLLAKCPPLAGIEAVILEMSQSNFSIFSQAPRHQELNLHEVCLQLSRY